MKIFSTASFYLSETGLKFSCDFLRHPTCPVPCAQRLPLDSNRRQGLGLQPNKIFSFDKREANQLCKVAYFCTKLSLNVNLTLRRKSNFYLNRYTISEEHSKYLAEEKSADSDAYEEFDDNYEQAKANTSRSKIILIIRVPKTLGRSIMGFQVANWFCYHIDDLDCQWTISPLATSSTTRTRA
jgi:hypothetical protein